jgi:hypothetical protein
MNDTFVGAVWELVIALFRVGFPGFIIYERVGWEPRVVYTR